MLHVFIGTDRDKARAALHAALQRALKGSAHVLRVSDASELADLELALRGRGMFDDARVVVLDNILGNSEMRDVFSQHIGRIAVSDEQFFLLEEKPDAATRKLLEKHAERVEKFDAAKREREGDFFALPNALRAGDKKRLWVLLQREYAKGAAPEMLHGTFFWAAKQMVLRPREEDAERGRKLVALLSALPHEARRRGEDLEYALERFVLSGA